MEYTTENTTMAKNKLNGALEGSAMDSFTIESILKNLDMNNGVLRNNAGGYYNHCLFWEVMSPNELELHLEL